MSSRLTRTVIFPVFLVATAALLGGCPIPQTPGAGKILHRQCRSSDSWYYLYVPENYDFERRYPMVLSLHGMKPYDKAQDHVKMWGKLADEHKFIICAPELRTSDSFGQFPLRHMGSAEVSDVNNVLGVMDEVIEDWEVDRDSVMLSSWSMGGYLAHYMMTEYGQRFAAFAPLQSNFSTDVLNAARARRFASTVPLFVFYGTVDFPGVTSESKESIEWYRRLGYRVQVKEAEVAHERHPELAAQFFEQVLAQQHKQIEIVVTPPGTEPAPLAVNLWPALSSKIGEVRSYEWSFERLGTSYQKSPNVMIRQPGNYPVRLTVTDAKGRRYIAQTTLTVPAPASARHYGSDFRTQPQPR